MAASSSGATTAADMCVCRCCLATGCDKDLLSSYLHSGSEEVYADMMKETFDIEFFDGIDSHSHHICDNCITELRRAYAFKKRTIVSSMNFLRHIKKLMKSTGGNIGNCSSTLTTLAKIEMDDEDIDNESDYFEVEVLDDTLEQEEEYGKTDLMKTEAISVGDSTRTTKRKIKHEEFEPKPEASNPRAQKRKKGKQSSHKVIKDNTTSEETVGMKIIKVESIQEKEEEQNSLDNLLLLLESSNMCIFHHNCSTQDEFQCYVCADTFPDLKLLREHTRNDHSTPEVVISVLRSETDSGILAEISYLECSKCDQPCDSLDNLIKHLTAKHLTPFVGKFSNLIPFKVVENGLVCGCGGQFSSFGVLREHSEVGCEELVMCDVCGEVVEGKGKMAEHIKKNHAADNRSKSYKRIQNAVAIVSNSNACPFHWPLVRLQRFKCYCCSQHFMDFPELRLHYTTDHDIEAFRKEVKLQGVSTPLKLEITDLKCTECEHACCNLEKLRAHLTGVHGVAFFDEEEFMLPMKIEGEGYKCLECAQQFLGWPALNRHVRVKHAATLHTWVCVECGKQFLSRKNLRYHVQNVHTDDYMSRPTALRLNTMALLEHSNMTIFHYEGVLFRCFCCQQSFLHFPELMQHSRTHDTQAVEAAMKKSMCKFYYIKVDITHLKCVKCQQGFDDIEGLKSHLTDSHGVKFWKNGENYLVPYLVNGCYQCGFCKKDFRVMQTLTRHINSHVSKEICEVCGSAFFNATMLKAHKRKVHGEIKCALCNITFESHNARRQHNKQHKGELPKRSHKCAFCDETFNASEPKYAHMKAVHDFQPPEYRCALCDRVFYTKGGYENHQVNHRKDRPRVKDVPCKHCRKRFTPHKLEDHIQQSHIEAHGFRCNLCVDKFSSADLLCRHLINRHSNNKPHCPLCKFLPNSKQFLLLHLKEVHKVGNNVDGEWVVNV